jgi:hypothetical protein
MPKSIYCPGVVALTAWRKRKTKVCLPSLHCSRISRIYLGNFIRKHLNVLDENLSFSLNPLTASKLDHFLSTLFEGLSETANKGKMFDQHVWNEKSKHCFIDEIVDIAWSATQILPSTFTNLFHQRFEKHSILESMLEILQQFYIQMETEPHDFLLFPGDYSLYTLRCM